MNNKSIKDQIMHEHDDINKKSIDNTACQEMLIDNTSKCSTIFRNNDKANIDNDTKKHPGYIK